MTELLNIAILASVLMIIIHEVAVKKRKSVNRSSHQRLGKWVERVVFLQTQVRQHCAM